MANFNTHLTGGFVVSGILATTCYKAGLLGHQDFLLCVAIGTAGGLLPDIDADNSRPIKLGFAAASLLFAFALVMHWRGTLSLLSLLGLWGLGYLLMRYAVFAVFTRLTVHRGIIHSIPYMLLLALGLVYLNYYLLGSTATSSWFYGLFLLVGSLTHLLLDELYSVNILGARMKRSYGTAMKVYQPQPPQCYYYLLLYVLLAMAVVYAPPFTQFWHQLTNPITWWLLQDALMPNMSVPSRLSLANL